VSAGAVVALVVLVVGALVGLAALRVVEARRYGRHS
jgi:Tfp pilus assembly protein PilX